MPTDFDTIIDYSDRMVRQDINNGRNDLFTRIDKLDELDFDLPDQTPAWVFKFIDTAPHDTLKTAVDMLTSTEPDVQYGPLYDNAETQKAANRIERALRWMWIDASKRRPSDPYRGIVKSALKYDAIMAQVVYLPYESRVLKANEMKGADYTQDITYGEFSIIVHNPRNVHVMEGEHSIKAVLVERVLAVHEVLSRWGKLANKLEEEYNAAADKFEEVTVYDYTDTTTRCVWAVPTTHTSDSMVQKGITILAPTAHDLPFLPWVIRQGGTSTDKNTKFRHRPLLYSIAEAKTWEFRNLVRSIAVSKGLKQATGADYAFSGPSAWSVEFHYDLDEPTITLPPGTDMKELSKPPLDRGLLEVEQMIGQQQQTATLPEILVSGNGSGNFSDTSLRTQHGIGKLHTYKRLAENALADCFTLMLKWIKQHGEASLTFARDGEQILIDPDEIADKIYIDVTLTANSPIDHQQRTNTAVQKKALGMSDETLMTEVGVQDPAAEMAKKRAELFDNHHIELELQKQRFDVEYQQQERMSGLQNMLQQVQQLQAELQGALQQVQQQTQMGPPVPPQGPGQIPFIPEGGYPPGALPAEQGGFDPYAQGYNPAQGGIPPIQAGADTYEQATGETRAGMPIDGQGL